MEYGRVLGRAWQITWRYKALWLFGFMLALFSSRGESSRGLQYTLNGEEAAAGPWIVPLILAAIAVALILAVIGVILRYTAIGALIAMTREIEETNTTSWRSGWRAGWSRFARLFGIDLVLGLPFVLVAMALMLAAAVPVILSSANGDPSGAAITLTVLAALAVFAVMIVAGLVISLLGNIAHRASVLGQRGVMDSIRTAWHELRAHAGHWGMWWLVMVGVNLVIAAIALPIAFGAAGIVAAAVAVSYHASQSALPAIVTGLVLGLPLLLASAAIRSVLETFLSVAWTLAYRELRPIQETIVA